MIDKSRHGQIAALKLLIRPQQSTAPQFVAHIGLLVAMAMPYGVPRIEEIALKIDLSSRTLQRRLKQHDTTYQGVIVRVRAKMARQLLLHDEASIIEIAFLLGFSESSAFSRAAGNWFGVAPSEMRRIGSESTKP